MIGNLELSFGIKKVYWGVTESLHLVDVINQTDQVESFDGEQKLGQPMAHLSYLSKVGNFDFFYLPYARKRVFPAKEGRLRFPVVIEQNDINVDSVEFKIGDCYTKSFASAPMFGVDYNQDDYNTIQIMISDFSAKSRV